jgi:MinD-like ATPase involved in chromosome partitioning or flagellar assembly
VTVRVATVLSAREWEPGLVAHARDTASIRVVLRAFQPRDIEAHAGDIDVVVAGGEVAWVTPHQISTWRRLGFAVIGIHPPGDAPAASLLELGGASEILPDDVDVAALVQAIRFVAPLEQPEATVDRGRVTAVVGARGAPGCTEVACAHAVAQSARFKTILIDADLTAPALAVRLGIAPRPDITDAADMVRSEGTFDRSCVRSVGRLDVVTGSHREGEETVRDQMLAGLVESAASIYERVVLDIGLSLMPESLLEGVDEVVLVIEATPIGIVRAARATRTWFGPTPQVVVNKVRSQSKAEIVGAVRRWTGLDPVAVVPHRTKVRRNSVAGKLPDRAFAKSLAGVGGTE